MVEEIIDFYYFGMVLHLKGINMIVFHLEYGLKEYNNVQDKCYLLDISLKLIGWNKYLLEIKDIHIHTFLLSLDSK